MTVKGTPSARVASPVAGIVQSPVARVRLWVEACPLSREKLKGVNVEVEVCKRRGITELDVVGAL